MAEPPVPTTRSQYASPEAVTVREHSSIFSSEALAGTFGERNGRDERRAVEKIRASLLLVLASVTLLL